MSQVTSARGRQENPYGQSVIETPSSANNSRILALPHVPRETDARPPLIEVTGNPLRHGGLVRSCALAYEDGGSPHWSLRLRVPRAVPAESVRQGDVSRQLPFILPVEAQVGLVVGEKSCGWTQERERLSIQSNALAEKAAEGDLSRSCSDRWLSRC